MTRRVRAAVFVGASAMLALHLVLCLDWSASHSAVFDEVVYPTSGYSYWTTGDYRLNAEHPPLLKLWTSLPWLGMGLPVKTLPGWDTADAWSVGRAMLFRGPRDPRDLLARARAMITLLSLGLAGSVFVVGRRYGGTVAALGALALYALDPLVIAHASVATTDLGAAAFTFAGASASLWAIRRPGPWGVVVAGLWVGAAWASKFSTLPLAVWVPVAAGLAARERGSDTRTAILRAAGILGAGALVVACTYGASGPWGYVEGLRRLAVHADVGHPAYALGRYGNEGWWWYFPVAWAVKTPLPILLLSGLGVGWTASRWTRARAAEQDPSVASQAPETTAPLRAADVWLLLGAPALLALPVAVSGLNLGVRHLLPVTPFLAVAGGLAAGALWEAGRRGGGRPPRVGAGVLLALCFGWLLAGTLRVHPAEMAYANEAAGGPQNLWRRLADSNVDWGQDLPALREAIAGAPLKRLYLGYFGTAEPEAYGLPAYVSIPAMGMASRRFVDGPHPDGREWIAVSVTNLLDVYSRRHDGYAWLRERAMTAFPGYSIALYDITGDEQARRALAATALHYGDREAAVVILGQGAPSGAGGQ